jgi:hypothetical protein
LYVLAIYPNGEHLHKKLKDALQAIQCPHMKTCVVTQKSVCRPFADCSEMFVCPKQDVKQMSVETTSHTTQQVPKNQVLVQEKGQEGG